jgi:hypothetical protein
MAAMFGGPFVESSTREVRLRMGRVGRRNIYALVSESPLVNDSFFVVESVLSTQ